MPISDTKARNAKPREKLYRIADGHGLCLEVRPSGRKVWRLRYRLDGKANMWTIGDYPQVKLGPAREQRDWGRELIAQGVHPRHQVERDKQSRKDVQALTFRSVAEEWIAKRSGDWSLYYAGQVRKGLDDDIYPAFGDKPIREVQAADVLELMREVEKRGAPSVALLLRQWTSAIFRYGIINLQADTDPASFIKGAVTRPKVKHARALPERELRFLLGQLEVFGGYRTTRLAIELLLLTMVRTVELRRGRWADIDLDAAIWRIPEADMKMRRPHLVPLSRQAVEKLKELKEYTGGGELLLPGMKNPRAPIHHTTINQALFRMGFGEGKFAAHGFRATASTVLNEQGWNPDAIERQLAHAPSNRTRASYNHAQHMDERKEMMQWWADYLDRLRDSREANGAG
ncbi:tyrosine-type recombinase/integrase [Halomonas sp. DP1Y21-3]|uniref:tyrosine-type recombinase/integrase n=1 Tax=Halomonas sp. DP1Y21-3 TaxID=2859080 RepID=UPI001C97450A|nr:tyrosine-type recombinase/integrase [Halomonas sp. DP1Y21-3]MBY6109115.1 tyrosine-type recombinase/integrase [Halomonas sp. DP1Y21-3]